MEEDSLASNLAWPNVVKKKMEDGRQKAFLVMIIVLVMMRSAQEIVAKFLADKENAANRNRAVVPIRTAIRFACLPTKESAVQEHLDGASSNLESVVEISVVKNFAFKELLIIVAAIKKQINV